MANTQPISASVSADMIQNAMRQPTADPSSVPNGTPSDKAIGVPTMAIAMACPC
ncbi:hypothetical protein D3C72_1740620 [compost metagenome]